MRLRTGIIQFCSQLKIDLKLKHASWTQWNKNRDHAVVCRWNRNEDTTRNCSSSSLTSIGLSSTCHDREKSTVTGIQTNYYPAKIETMRCFSFILWPNWILLLADFVGSFHFWTFYNVWHKRILTVKVTTVATSINQFTKNQRSVALNVIHCLSYEFQSDNFEVLFQELQFEFITLSFRVLTSCELENSQEHIKEFAELTMSGGVDKTIPWKIITGVFAVIAVLFVFAYYVYLKIKKNRRRKRFQKRRVSEQKETPKINEEKFFTPESTSSD